MEGEYIFKTFLFYFFFALFFGSYDVLGKKYMNIFFKSPYFLMFSIGIIVSIVLLIVDLFLHNLNSGFDGIITGFQNNITSVSKFFIFVCGIIIEWIWCSGIWLTISYFTPCHYFVSEYISEYIYYIVKATSSNEGFYSNINIVIFSISFFINFFCCLAFNEIIILNFYGLDYNTSKRIQEREKEEIAEITSKHYSIFEDDFDKEDEED